MFSKQSSRPWQGEAWCHWRSGEKVIVAGTGEWGPQEEGYVSGVKNSGLCLPAVGSYWGAFEQAVIWLDLHFEKTTWAAVGRLNWQWAKSSGRRDHLAVEMRNRQVWALSMWGKNPQGLMIDWTQGKGIKDDCEALICAAGSVELPLAEWGITEKEDWNHEQMWPWTGKNLMIFKE